MPRDVKRSLRIVAGLALALLLAGPAYGDDDDDDDKDKLAASALTPTSVTHQSAVLSGTVEADDDATWLIRYGTTAKGLDQATKAQRVPVGIRPGPVGVTAALTGLPAATTMYARLEVRSDDDVERGDVTTFTTAPAPAPAESAPREPAPQPQPQPQPQPAEPTTPPAPALGTQLGVATQQGSVRVRLPGGDAFVDLANAAALPVGTVVDAREGAIALSAALPGGAVQEGSFGGAKFQLRQRKRGTGRVDIHLRGGNFAACRARSLSAVASGKRPRPTRRMWGKDRGGRFRTYGRDSVTTVRGTEWTVADTCAGTVTRVTEGAVDVKVRRTGRVVRVEAGERFLARHRRR
jgi:hypothetical protein